MQPTKPTPTEALVEALVALLTPRIADELAKRNDAVAERSSSNPPRDLQRSKNPRRIIAERCRAGLVAGAVKRGRDWYFAAEAWEASRRSAPAPRLRLAAPVAESEADAAARDLEAAGLRAIARRSA